MAALSGAPPMDRADAPWPWLGDAAATAARRDALWALLGPRPALPPGTPVSGERLAVRDHDGHRLEQWRLTLNTAEPVPAWLVLPVGRRPRGVVLYNHAHGGRFDIGADEVLSGRPALQSPPYGSALPGAGWAVLAIDHFGFGARQSTSERVRVKRLLWQGCTLWGWRLHDTLAALDWLQAQPALAGLPVVTLGLSMGSTMAVWAAALDTRLAGCIDLCCLAEYDALLADGSLDRHAEYFFVPGLLNHFSAAEISALIAPRPHLSLAGRHDPLTPPDGLAAIDTAMQRTYAAFDASSHWQQHVQDAGHEETPAMRQAVFDWLARHHAG